MISIALTLLLVGAPGGQGVGGTVSRGNFLPIPQYRTPGDGNTVNYYVDPTGSDGNTCTTSGTGACLTIQGAINKIPKLIRDAVTVNVAAGTYTGFIISGFTVDNGLQQTTGGLTISGAFSTASVATGTATGTATGGTAGTTTTFGTLVDSGQSWTVNNLRGKFIFINSGTGVNQRRVISSNTGTTITITGNWTAPVNGSSVYTIQNAGASIATATTIPPSNTTGALSGGADVFIANNSINYTGGGITLSGLSISGVASVGGVVVADPISAVTLLQDQITTAVGAPDVYLGDSVGFANVPSHFTVTDTYMTSSGGFCVDQVGGVGGLVQSLRSMFDGCNYAIYTIGAYLFVQRSYGFNCDDACFVSGIGGGNISTSQVACNAGGGRMGFSSGNTTPGTHTAPELTGALLIISTTSVATCDIGVGVNGTGALASVTSLTGTAAVSGFTLENGGAAYFSAATTLTGTTQDININNGAVTGALSDVASGSCLGAALNGSRICKQ